MFLVNDGIVFEELEDKLLGEDETNLVADTVEEFNVLSAEWMEGQRIGSLLYMEGYQALLAKATRDAANAILEHASFRCKSDRDREKKQRLEYDMNCAIDRRDWIKQVVENAASVQKPVLRKD